MPDGSEKVLSLSDYKGKWVVLFFYPLDFTFVCPTEIISFSEAAAEFQKSNCEVIGASIDSYYSHLAWTQQDRKKGGLGKMNIPLLADVNRRCSEAYGCLMEEDGHTCRATYIIDPQGNLRHFAMNDPPVGRNVEDVLRLVQGYKHADEHPGFVCPMNCT